MDQWIDISGYEGRYRISAVGNVMSYRGKRIKLRLASNGYLRVWLLNDLGYKPYTVHRIVAMAFIPNPSNKQWVNHKNGIKTDNRVENLEWVTQSENQKHAFANGLQIGNRGEKNGHAKLTWDQIEEIRSTSFNYKNHSQIALKFGVSRRTINRIIKGLNWNKK